MRYVQLGNHGNLYAVTAVTGAILTPVYDPTNGWEITIPSAATYMFPIGGEQYGAGVETVMHSISAIFSAALAGTMTIEGTNCPKTTTGVDQGGWDVSDFDTSAAWQLIDITLAGSVYAVASGSGNSVAKYTLTIGGSNAGGALWNLPDMGMLRLRAKLVASAGGTIRVAANAKLGS